MSERTGVAVVGGGITGLALGYHLARAGVAHKVLEASERPGGVVRSGRVEGHLLEWGPQRTRLTADVRELVEDLGLMQRLVLARKGLPLLVFRDGKLRRVPFSASAFLRSDIVPFGSKLRLLLEPITAGARDDESVETFFVRKLGRKAYENIAGPLYGGLYASDPADMEVGLSLRHALRELGVGRSLVLRLLRRGGQVEPPAACSFDDGLEVLPHALYGANTENVELSTPVGGLIRTEGRWQIETERGSLVADRVVLTAPAPACARLLAAEAPTTAHALHGLTYNRLAVVHLHADTALTGLGYQVSLAERLATRGVTFNDSLFGRRGVYTAYLGGARAPGVVDWMDEEIGAVAVREFRAVTGYESRSLSVAREGMPAWDRTWAALKNLSLPPGISLATNWESRPGLPGRLAQAKRIASELAKSLS
ncbi:MAG: protoporphyrinogen oxidase [Gemmatimonadota bacterium]